MAPGTGPFAESWRLYRELGWLGTLKLPKTEKHPVPTGFTGAKYSGAFPSEKFCEGWSYTHNANIGLRLPKGVIGLDVDHGYADKSGRLKRGGDDLAKLEVQVSPLPPTWLSTRREYDVSGIRFYQVPEDLACPEDLTDDIEIIHHDYRYAVAWPSVVPDQETGELLTYWWYTPEGERSERPPRPEELPELPAEWVEYLREHAHQGGKKAVVRREDYPEDVRIPDEVDPNAPWFIKALAHPDATGRGNNASLSIVGGLVNAFIESGLPYEAALAFILNYERASSFPQPDHVVAEQLERIWAQEKANRRETLNADFSEVTGWLMDRKEGFGYDTLTSNFKDRDETTTFSDFKIQATGVHTAGGKTVWTVDLTRSDGQVFRDVELSSDILNSTAALRGWATGHQCSLFFMGDRDKRGSAGIRLQLLMRSQKPVECRVIRHLGWDDTAKGFVTYEGLITADGLRNNASVRPARDLATTNLVNHHYGFRSPDEAREVLREVLTFHEETFTSVFTSWLVAGTLKGHLRGKASLFPIFIVEATSESGKTKGFSQLISQLWGNRDKEGGIGTRASIRNALTAHRGAPVHIDDSDNLDDIREILRQATVEGFVDKTGEDKRTTVRSKLLAPVWISVENANLGGEKALMDRIVTVTMPSPKGRMSLKDPSRPQWDDVLAMQEQYGGESGLTVFAGTLTQMILQHAHHADDFSNLAGSAGRHADKMAVLRVGARVLADVTGDDRHVKRVDAWCAEQVDTGEENALTMVVVPEALRVLGANPKPLRIDRPPHYGIPTPVIVAPAPTTTEPDAIWVHIGNLAAWWEKHKNGRIETRTQTASAFAGQAASLGMKGSKTGNRNVDWAQFGVDNSETRGASRQNVTFQRVPDDIAQTILARLEITIEEAGPTDLKRLNQAQQTGVERS
ncbi:bifunctional DNA primase/polymerase [Streptomyces mirabilis]|uniref:bifunctional DNA primase/polymerase n=1 Tax=Streptomyces mirabilis TaxID=68239 RepID=UPI00225603CF|nr:bifunctional DNA primase/polymerase [Streptomyces mirabilis]MCX4612110.1 hypothetical protein [Streptomyces mirabilis]